MSHIFRFPPEFIPDPVVWSNYPKALTKLPFDLYLANTLIIVAATLVGELGVSAIVAFAFARLRWRGRDALFIVVLATMMLPRQVTLIPDFLIFRYFGMYDTYWPLVIPSWFGNPFYIFLIRQYFMTISRELDEAALLDGCSKFGVFWRITMPLSLPVLAAVAIFSFQYHWNDFFRPLILPVRYRQSHPGSGLALFPGHLWHRMELADGGFPGGDDAADHRLLLRPAHLHPGRRLHRLQMSANSRFDESAQRTNTAHGTSTAVSEIAAAGARRRQLDGWLLGQALFDLCHSAVLPSMRKALDEPDNGAVFSNFALAAGTQDGERKGTMWSDGDCYKYMEALSHVYGVSKDPAILDELDALIDMVAAAQEADGYLSTPMQLRADKQRWSDLHDHELYNMGHLLTAASVHHRITGQSNFLQIAINLADYLHDLFQPRPPELAHFGFNPSNTMGAIDLYRVTGEQKYLDLAKTFVDMRGSQPGGKDLNQSFPGSARRDAGRGPCRDRRLSLLRRHRRRG